MLLAASLLGARGKKPPPKDAWRLVHVAPWIALIGLAAFWPKPAREPARPGLSEDAALPPHAFEEREPGRGRLAALPHHIPQKGWRDIVWRTWKEIGADRLQIVAAGVTFYALLAVFPALGAFVSLYGLVADINQVERQLTQLAAILPPGAVDLIGEQMVRLATSKGATLSVAFASGVLLSVWSANAGMRALFVGLNIAYDETEKRGWIRLTLVTLGFTLGALVFVTAVSAILIGIPAAMGQFGYTPQEQLWLGFRWVLLLAVAMAAFATLYRFGPSRARARWAWVTWGGVFAALAWLAASSGFSFYVNTFANYDRTYGPLGAVIGFMVWIWVSVLVLLLGAELNSEIEHQTAVDTTTGPPAPMGARGAVMADTVGMAYNARNAAKVEARPIRVWSRLRKRPAP